MMILRKYELIKEDKLTFAAYLLFTSNNSPITSLQIGRFKDAVTIIDNIVRAVPLMTELAKAKPSFGGFDNSESLRGSMGLMRERLQWV